MSNEMPHGPIPIDVVDRLRSAVSTLLQALAAGRYGWLERETGGRRLSADQLRDGADLVGSGVSSDSAFEALRYARVVRLEHDMGPAFRVLVPLMNGRGELADIWTEIRLLPTRERKRFDTEIVSIGHRPPAEVESISQSDLRMWGKDVVAVPDPAKPVPEQWRPVITALVQRLADRDYAGLARDGFVIGSSEPGFGGIGTWIEDYPDDLVALPDEAWDVAQAIFSEHWDWERPASREAYVHVDLWGRQGRTDLTMECEATDDGTRVQIRIGNVHVM